VLKLRQWQDGMDFAITRHVGRGSTLLASVSVTNMPETEESVALVLLLLIAIVERLREVDRKWVIDTYAECLATVRMEEIVTTLR
jgi:hypothetical protein